mmetsp:Transcript_17641/g.48464  ORF Transcript_17641/g.48464 Transcript_17641/m.48464 type:complete len:207 (+) Transcript_17641:299-919(+)
MESSDFGHRTRYIVAAALGRPEPSHALPASRCARPPRYRFERHGESLEALDTDRTSERCQLVPRHVCVVLAKTRIHACVPTVVPHTHLPWPPLIGALRVLLGDAVEDFLIAVIVRSAIVGRIIHLWEHVLVEEGLRVMDGDILVVRRAPRVDASELGQELLRENIVAGPRRFQRVGSADVVAFLHSVIKEILHHRSAEGMADKIQR